MAVDVLGCVPVGAGEPRGFLSLRRFTLRNRYADGSASRPYACDVVSRRQVRAVAIVLYEHGPGRRLRVALRVGLRPAVVLGADRPAPPDPHEALIAEVVAGLIEDEDRGPLGVARRAATEAREEAGYAVAPEATRPLGGALFPSPGISDECVHFCAAEVALEAGGPPSTDGSPMEEPGRVVLLSLDEALAACRGGRIPDMKTEVALLRLCDDVGYLPLLDRFVDELPEGLRPSPARRAWLGGSRAEP